MTSEIDQQKKNIIATGRLLWDKDLVTALNGNISVRLDDGLLLLTATKTCLGTLKDSDVLTTNGDGDVIGEGKASSERLLHTEIYKNFPDIKAVVHTHTTYTNAYFLQNDSLVPQIFESRFYLGEVKCVAQMTPSVTDAAPVIAALRGNNIVVLKNHGVVAMGKDLFDAFLLIQCLEDAVKIDAISRLYQTGGAPGSGKADAARSSQAQEGRRYKLFSKEQIDEIVRLVNGDAQLTELGQKTNMTMGLAVKLDETGQTYRFDFEQGRIKNVYEDDQAEFVITAPEKIWRAVFNREIDPFVATTQKKMNLNGDFARISKWYAPCSRIFELWQRVPVE